MSSLEETPVAVYLRMSDSKQENSIERQQLLIGEYCKQRRYKIVKTYKDEGIAGDEFDKRKGLHELLRDAKGGKFKVIVCDERSRLSRMRDHDEFVVKIKYPLKQLGIRLETVKDGPVDWTATDWKFGIMDQIDGAMSAEEVKQLARRVLTGYVRKAREGKAAVGPAPYGYCWSGNEERQKPPLLPKEPAAAIVRWLFEEYDAKETSLTTLEHRLNTDGVPPPRPEHQRSRTRHLPEYKPAWNRATIRNILTNIVYTGALAYNRKPHGKYVRFTNDKPEFISNPKLVTFTSQPQDIIIKEGTHEPLVSLKQFRRVQEKLQRNQVGRRPVTMGGYLLSGLLRCGRCGNTICGAHASIGGKNNRKVGPREYICVRTHIRLSESRDNSPPSLER
jgi:site-specific DNA recombinase